MTSGRSCEPSAPAARRGTAEIPAAPPLGSRERLLRGMALAVAGEGYGAASVSRVLALSGASRATFYEHFSNREECFLAAHREAAGRALRAVGTDRGGGVRLAVALEEALVRAAENPAATRLLLVEAPGAGRVAREDSERFRAGLEASIDASLAPDHLPQLPTSALVDGIAGVVAARLCGGRGETLPRLASDLMAWGRSYLAAPGERRLGEAEWRALGASLPAAEPGREPDPSLLPRGRSALDAATGAASRRRRIVVATAQAVAARGYAGFTVADVVAAARVPRSAFYAQFSGKREAFLAVQEEVLREAMAAAAARFVVGEEWPERIWNGLEALLYYVAERPDLARAGIVEVQAAGNAAVVRLHETALAFTLFLEEGYRLHPPPTNSRVLAEAIAFSIQGAMRRVILRWGAGRLPEFLPLCSHLALAPFLGPRQSLEFVSRRARTAG